ncbi:hypothetical protein CYLTODRAFT_362592, partial [Cylindrobasidium torrendii FP15055 ss-10]
RCFPHVINISVQTGLDRLTKDLPHFRLDAVYGMDNVLKAARALITAIRSSDQRRAAFLSTITSVNDKNNWQDGDSRALRIIMLVKDVETRWSSTFLMIDRLLELHLAVQEYIQNDHEIPYISNDQFRVLKDIRRFLAYPHFMQELLSAERTPTLARVIPMYERLIQLLRNKVRVKLPKLRHAIDASIAKLEEYLDHARCTDLYVLAMGEYNGLSLL